MSNLAAEDVPNFSDLISVPTMPAVQQSQGNINSDFVVCIAQHH